MAIIAYNQPLFAQRSLWENDYVEEIPAKVKADWQIQRPGLTKRIGKHQSPNAGPNEYKHHGLEIAQYAHWKPVINTESCRRNEAAGPQTGPLKQEIEQSTPKQ